MMDEPTEGLLTKLLNMGLYLLFLSLIDHIQTTIAIGPLARILVGRQLVIISTTTDLGRTRCPCQCVLVSGAGSAGGHNPKGTKAARPPAKVEETNWTG